MIKNYTIVFCLAILSLKTFAATLPGGTYKVGKKSGDNFSNLDSAINAANKGITGTVIFLLTDTGYSITSSLIIRPSSGTSAVKTLTIKPDIGVTARISGSVNTAIFKINTSYVTIDGNNLNLGKNLTINNTYAGVNNVSVVIWFADSSTTYGSTNNTIQNCILYGSSNSTTFACVFSGGSTISAFSGATSDNSNNIIQNNIISKAENGIYILGASATLLESGLKILNNILGSSVIGDGFIGSGTTVKYQTNATIRGNDIQNLVYSGNYTLTDGENKPINVGLYLYNSTNSYIDSNKIHNLNFSGLAMRLCYGLSLENFAFNTSDHVSNNYVYNNMIYDCRSAGFTSGGWLFSGINENGGYRDQFYFNTVYLSGDFSSYKSSVAAFSNGNSGNITASPALVVKNNF